jgi:hypothetical protein
MSAVGAILGTAAVAIGRGAAAAAGDGLSFASQLLRAAGGEAPQQPEPDGTLSLTARAGALRERIRRHLAALGIELSQPVELVGDGIGRITVAGAHPQRAAIEEALSGDVLLEREFHELGEAIVVGSRPQLSSAAL